MFACDVIEPMSGGVHQSVNTQPDYEINMNTFHFMQFPPNMATAENTL